MAFVRDRLTEIAARSFRVPENVAAVTQIGEEEGGAQSQGQAQALWEKVLDLYRSGMHPGMQICVRHQNKVVMNRSIGHRNGVFPGKSPSANAAVMRVDTPVNLFSGAKAVTSIMMHRLEADGVLRLDVPIAEYLPGFERNGKAGITLQQVLNHRAGIPSLPAEAFDLDLLSDPDEVEQIVINMTPTHEIGGAPHYHAISGGFVMSAVVKKLTGMSLREYTHKTVKEPLGLKWFDYGVEPAQTDQVARNVMTGFRLGPLISRMMDRLLGIPWEVVVDLSNDARFLAGEIPSGNLISTASDAAAFYQCLLNGGELDGVRVFKEEMVRKLLHTPEARLEIDRMIGLPMRYGNGFMMGSSSVSLYGWNHPRAFGHLGMSNSLTWANPDRDLVVALLTTGKPVLGMHLGALPKLIKEIHTQFPISRRRL